MKVAFEVAVTQHADTVLRVCRAVLGATTDADDAWSETFLAALQEWPSLDDDTNVEAWLVRVAHRKAIDVVRSQSRRAVRSSLVPPEALQEHSWVEDGASTSEGSDGIWEAVSALPEKQRLAIAYHYCGGLSHVETAELTGSTPDAVRRAAADGMKKLRKIYDHG